MNLKFTSFGG